MTYYIDRGTDMHMIIESIGTKWLELSMEECLTIARCEELEGFPAHADAWLDAAIWHERY